jgi:hypothetical protein
MTIRDLLATGYVRGFSCGSRYAKDLFERRYNTEQKTFKVEKKKDMKKRIGRSPDNGDAFSYGAFIIWQSGLLDAAVAAEERFKNRGGELVDKYYRSFDKRRVTEEEEDGELVSSILEDDSEF